MKINRLVFTSFLLVIAFAPSPAGSRMIPVIAKEAKYFEREGLALDYVRVGGSAQIIHAGEPAIIPAVQRGADTAVIAATSRAVQVYGKFASINDEALLEANWQEYAGHLLRVPRPTFKGIQQVIDSGTVGKGDVKAERLVDMSLVDELEKSGFIDSVYKE